MEVHLRKLSVIASNILKVSKYFRYQLLNSCSIKYSIEFLNRIYKIKASYIKVFFIFLYIFRVRFCGKMQ